MAKQPSRLDERTVRLAQRAFLLGIAAVLGLTYLLSDPFRAEVNRAAALLSSGDLAGMRDYLRGFGPWAPVVSLAFMVFQALAAPIPSFLVSYANGMVFGVFWGWLLSATGHVLAASLCFWLARALGRGPVTALVGRAGLESADRWFGRWGAHAVLVTRLIPGISFDVVSYAAGLTGMGLWRFTAATALGVLPGTLVHSYLGDRAPQYGWIPFVGTALFAAAGAMVAVRGWWRRANAGRPGPRQAPAVAGERVGQWWGR
jgi:uncharacterized membrane protein YdjX (TVP38/TMEM64 family)